MSKSAKKNAARKAKKASEVPQSSQPSAPVSNAGTGSDPGAPQAPRQVSQRGGEAQGAADESNEKRIRALKKKLRQISELQDKQATGADLTPEQMAKLDSMATLCVPIPKSALTSHDGPYVSTKSCHVVNLICLRHAGVPDFGTIQEFSPANQGSVTTDSFCCMLQASRARSTRVEMMKDT